MSRKCLIFLVVMLVVVMTAGCSKESPAAKPQEEIDVQANESNSLPQTEVSQPPAQSEPVDDMLSTDTIPAILVEFDRDSWGGTNPNTKMWQVSADGTGAFSKRELEGYYINLEWYENRRYYNEVDVPDTDGLILVGRNGKYGFIDFYGNEIIKVDLDEALQFSENFASVKKDGRYGYINRQGEFIINTTHYTRNNNIRGFGEFHNGLAWFYGPSPTMMSNMRYGYTDTNGAVVIEPQFSEISNFINGFAVVKDDSGFWGVIDINGDYVIKPTWSDEQYNDNPRFYADRQFGTNGLFSVSDRMEGTTSHYNQNGNVVLQHDIDDVLLSGRAVLQYGGYTTTPPDTRLLYNQSSETLSLDGQVIRENVTWLYYTDDIWIIRIGEKYGIIDNYGNFIMEPQDKKFILFNRGLPGFQDNEKFGYIDKFGNEVIAAKFDGIGSFSNGIAKVMINDKWGLIDTSGNFVIEPQYDDIGDPWIDEWIAVEVDGKWGFIDKNDSFVIEPQFDGVTDFFGNIAFVWQEGLRGIISRNGSFIAEPTNTLAYTLIYEGIFITDGGYGKTYES